MNISKIKCNEQILNDVQVQQFYLLFHIGQDSDHVHWFVVFLCLNIF